MFVENLESQKPTSLHDDSVAHALHQDVFHNPPAVELSTTAAIKLVSFSSNDRAAGDPYDNGRQTDWVAIGDPYPNGAQTSIVGIGEPYPGNNQTDQGRSRDVFNWTNGSHR